MPEPERKPDEAIRISARDARGGEIILRKRRQRVLFIAGLVGLVVLVLVLQWFA